jgi:hypothetical protein
LQSRDRNKEQAIAYAGAQTCDRGIDASGEADDGVIDASEAIATTIHQFSPDQLSS